MKNHALLVLVLGILFLFILQSAGTLVESIYILDLMNSNLDEKALGVLFFFSPLLALPFFKRAPRWLLWFLLGLLFVTRGLTPYLPTAGRLTASGLATGASLSLLFLLLRTLPPAGQMGGAGLALAVALSAMLRAVGEGIEYSLIPAGGWAGWLLGLLLVGLLIFILRGKAQASLPPGGKLTLPILGIYLILTLIHFSFSAPAVIARWTEGNYTLIVCAVSLYSLVLAWLLTRGPQMAQFFGPRLLGLMNLIFTQALFTVLRELRFPFPPTPDSPAVVIGAPTWLNLFLLGILLLVFPVLFLDMQSFLRYMQIPTGGWGRLGPGMLLGGLAWILLIFINIFTNVWGYIEPVSPLFRNTFWLAFFLLAAGITLVVWFTRLPPLTEAPQPLPAPWPFIAGLAAIFLVTLIFALPSARVDAPTSGVTSLRAMTFNTQQSNDDFAEKSIEAQLALIRQVSPDILALQESDSARISLNNNDYVRYFAEKLGYYSYYGPTPVTGTFGTAILSRYPLQNTRSVFIYSDKDETGVAEAEIEVNGLRFTIYNVHPDSSDLAMLVFAHTLVERAADKAYVIALGDYNLRDYEEAYQWIDQHLVNAWTSVYPDEIGTDGLDMSGDNRIDHIFLSRNLQAVNPMYILPPESATDHPVHWTDVVWGER